MLPPTFADVDEAARRLAGAAHRTLIVSSRTVDGQTGAQLFFKCENLQRAGSFKFRGAFNALSRLTNDERRRGIVAFSSGNHAQAVALAGRELGINCVVVMPTDAPAIKRRATQAYGAEIVAYDRSRDDREAIGRCLAQERALTLVPPYDHPAIIGGAGTAARELFEDAGPLDWLFVPCGGGGLLSGSALAAKALCPTCRVIGVEPAAADDATRSFRSGTLQTVHNPPTVADGARTPSLGALTFPIVLRDVADMSTVDDATLLEVMFFLWERLKLVVEPTGALAAAAALRGSHPIAGQRVGIILSGGNVDLSDVPNWLARLSATDADEGRERA
jgi:threonine dehydratase